jgi:hypothetical protein
MNEPEPPAKPRRRAQRETPKDSPLSKLPAPANDAGASVFGSVFQPADMRQWASFPCWDAFEAACVTCGFNPYPLKSASRRELETQPHVLSKIEYRHSLFERSIRMNVVGEHITPTEALQILEARNCEFPTELMEIALKVAQFARKSSHPAASATGVLKEILASEAGSGGRFKSKSGQTKVINLYQRMLLAVSLEYLELVPQRPQNPTAKLFLKAMARHFKDLPDEDTVRDHISFWINDQMER